jgi:hypothetical protein
MMPPRAAVSPGVGDVRALLRAIGAAKTVNANCDLGTMVVIDLPDGSARTVESVTYQEDLAGALVIKAGPALPAGDLADAMAFARDALDRGSSDGQRAALAGLVELLGGAA